MKELSETTETHLLYSKFRTIGTQVAPLIAELERRAMAHPEELSSLLAECQTTYFQCRKTLIAGRLTAELKTLDPTRSDLVELVSFTYNIHMIMLNHATDDNRREPVAATSNSCAPTSLSFIAYSLIPEKISYSEYLK